MSDEQGVATSWATSAQAQLHSRPAPWTVHRATLPPGRAWAVAELTCDSNRDYPIGGMTVAHNASHTVRRAMPEDAAGRTQSPPTRACGGSV